jgi:CubicO group peptidase (beta-lactamase class C family)
MTKPMVAVGALKLLEQGRITINDPVSKYLPQFTSMKVARLDPTGQQIVEMVPASRPITLHDLFRHTSGLIYGGRGTTAVHKMYPAGSSDAATTLTSTEFLDKLGSAPLLWQPGTVWDYGFSIDVLGLVIEKITQQSLGSYLRDQVFQPLGMSDTGFVVPQAKVTRYARPFPNDPDTGKPQPQSDMTMPLKFECGGGCATSTAGDYLRFAQMLLDHGTLDGTSVLGRKTVEYMLSNQLGPDVKNLIGNADPTRAGYGFGLGLAVRTTPGIVPLLGSVGDFSWPGATGTNWWVDPKEKLVVVFMAATPGPLRWYYRESINALVMQALE